MSERKNNPERVRERLLLAVGELIVSDGIAQISIQKVADKAGVSKGGLFYHFDDKEALLLAYFDSVLHEFGRAIDKYKLGDDFENYADFVKAYAQATFDELMANGGVQMAILQFVSYQDYKAHWQNWLDNKANQDSYELNFWRYAIDGIWLNRAVGAIDDDELEQIKRCFFAKSGL